MLNKKLCYCIYILCIVVLYNNSHAQVGSPEVIPPSPNAAGLASFDLIKASPYTGTQNYSIPLHVVNFDGSSVPISLSYSGKGVRTNQEASFVGLSWALNFGGSISRTVQGYDDLSGLGYPSDTVEIPDYIDVANDKITLDGVDYSFSESDYWVNYLNRPKVDTEPDLFHYNFMGQSGSFVFKKKILDTDPIEVLKMTKDASRITFNESGSSFEITTASGFTGVFSVFEYNTSVSGISNGTVDGCDPTNIDFFGVLNDNKRVITSWYLEKIISPNGRELLFEYDLTASGYSNHLNRSYKSFSEKKSFDNAFQVNNGFTEGCSFRITEEVYPKRIYTDYGEVDVNFNYVSRTDIEAESVYKSHYESIRGESFQASAPLRLTSIQINGKPDFSSFSKSISLVHGYFNSGQGVARERLKLEKVQVGEDSYSFTYENGLGGLPDKSTRGMDYWGFYNGKDSNTELVPVNISYTSVSRFIGPAIGTYVVNDLFYYQTDDRKADFDYGKAGLLTEVGLPTGGAIAFTYEPHEYKLDGKEFTPVEGNVYMHAPQQNGQDTIVTSSVNYYTGSVFSSTGGTCNESLKINYSLQCTYNGAPGNTPCSLQVGDYNIPAVELVNADTGQPVIGATVLFGDLGDHIQINGSYSLIGQKSLDLPAGNYFIRTRSTIGFNAGATATYGKTCDGVSQATVNNTIKNQKAGGARIHSISTKDSEGDLVNIRSYDYMNFDPADGHSSGFLMNPLMNFGLYTQQTYDSVWVDNGERYYMHSGNIVWADTVSSLAPTLLGYIFSSGSSVGDQFSAQGNHVGYQKVVETIEGSSGNGMGQTRFTFSNTPNAINDFGTTAIINYGPVNGILESQSIISEENLFLGSSINFDNYEVIEAVKALKLDQQVASANSALYSSYKLNSYFIAPRRIESQEVVNGQVLDKETFNEFDSSYLLKKETIILDNGDSLVNEYLRPMDVQSPSSIIQNMISANIIAPVIEQRSSKNGEYLSIQGTKYDAVNTNFLPTEVYSYNRGLGAYSETINGQVFSSALEKKVVMSYDSFGNIQEVEDEAGSVTTYLWGYNGLYPVAKIENASYSEVVSLIDTGILVNPNSQPQLKTMLDDLRNEPALSHAQITLMIYDLSIGLLTAIDPNGREMNYEYDALGRLTTIRDHDKNIIKHIEYNYYNAN